MISGFIRVLLVAFIAILLANCDDSQSNLACHRQGNVNVVSLAILYAVIPTDVEELARETALQVMPAILRLVVASRHVTMTKSACMDMFAVMTDAFRRIAKESCLFMIRPLKDLFAVLSERQRGISPSTM